LGDSFDLAFQTYRVMFFKHCSLLRFSLNKL
jgi:hypothetical protein